MTITAYLIEPDTAQITPILFPNEDALAGALEGLLGAEIVRLAYPAETLILAYAQDSDAASGWRFLFGSQSFFFVGRGLVIGLSARDEFITPYGGGEAVAAAVTCRQAQNVPDPRQPLGVAYFVNSVAPRLAPERYYDGRQP